MTAAPTTLPIRPALRTGRPARAEATPRDSRLTRALDLFCLCRQIALYTDAGRTPPKALLEELGVRPPE